MRVFMFVLLFLLPIVLNAAEGDTMWTRTYGGSDYDEAYGVAVDDSGNYVIAGITKSFGEGNGDFWVLKLDALNGDTFWTKSYGGPENDQARDVAIDTAGYYLLCGQTNSFGAGGSDFWVLKVDPNTGDTIWARTYGDTGYEDATSIAVDEQGYYLVLGYTTSYGSGSVDMWLLKLDPQTGDTVWAKTYGGVDRDFGNSIVVDPSGYYVVVGYSESYDTTYYDYWIMKLDPSTGDTIWMSTFGGQGTDKAYSVAVDSLGYYVVAGYSDSYSGNADFWILKVDPNSGDTVWSHLFGGDSTENAYAVSVDSVGFYIVTGYTNSYGSGGSDLWLLKLDPSTGDTVWSKTYGGSDYDDAYAMVIDSANYYIVVGGSRSYGAVWSDVWALKIEGTPPIQVEEGISMVSPLSFGTISEGGIRLNVQRALPEFKLSVYDVSGRLIERLKLDDFKVGEFFIPLNSGIYILKMDSGKWSRREKVVVIR